MTGCKGKEELVVYCVIIIFDCETLAGRDLCLSSLFSFSTIPLSPGVRIGPPPDLPSLLLHNRIVYIGMPLVPAVTELIIAELLYLNYESTTDPITMYINSSGTTTADGQQVGFETEAFAIADVMKVCNMCEVVMLAVKSNFYVGVIGSTASCIACPRETSYIPSFLIFLFVLTLSPQYVRPPVHTVALGQAFGAAAMLLAQGKRGQRFALPNATILLNQPRSMARGQASDIAIKAREVAHNRQTMCELFAGACQKPVQNVMEDCSRVKYLQPEEAVDYGLIDKVIENEALAVKPSFMSQL